MGDEKKEKKQETDEERRMRRTLEASKTFKQAYKEALEDDAADAKHEMGEKNED